MWLIDTILKLIGFGKSKRSDKKNIEGKEEETKEIVIKKFEKTNSGALILSQDPEIAAKELEVASIETEINMIKRRVDDLKFKEGGLSEDEAEELNSLEFEISLLMSKLDSIVN